MKKEETTKKETTKNTSTEKKTVEKKSTEKVPVKKKLKKKPVFLIGIIGILIIALVIGVLALNNKEEEKEPTQETITETVKETYRVTFDSNGGTTVEEQLVEEGSTVNEPTSPTKENNIFVEWQLDGENYDFSTPVESDIVLVATWQELKQEQETVIVTFDSNGGSKVASKTIIKGEKVTKPSNPTRNGYTFSKWTLNGKIYDFSKAVSSNITLKATWKKVETEQKPETKPESKPEVKPETKYTVAFDSNGGSAVSSQSIVEGKTASKPADPTRSGYTFTGWTLDGKAFSFDTKITKNITLKATWKEVVLNKYTVTFDSKGGSAVSSQTVTEGQAVTKPADPTRNGYTFSGWKLNGSAYNFGSAVTGNITLVATWTQKNYTIKATAVDSQSPARVLSVYENGTKINVQSIKYSDGTLLCSGSNMNVNVYALDDTSYKVVLSDGTEVTASLVS